LCIKITKGLFISDFGFSISDLAILRQLVLDFEIEHPKFNANIPGKDLLKSIIADSHPD